MKMTSKIVTAVAGVLLLGSVPAPAADSVERFTAYAVNLNGARTRTGTVDISVERWSTDQEREALVGDIKEGGNDLLLRRLQKADRVGYIRSATNIGYPLRFASAQDLPGGGKRILLATDRPMGFFEATNGGRRSDYPFLLIDIHLDANGKGEGKLLNFARVNWADEGTIEVENWEREPVRLTNVHRQ
jgi:hypothetical protein